MVRTLKDDGLAHLGPFRSKQAADLVVAALWDATAIRRCRSSPSERSGPCAPAQLGVAACPCDGSLLPGDYRPIVEGLIEGLDSDPALVLTPLADKMGQLSDQHRYEEAGWLRDRHNALARAIERRQVWSALNVLGFCEVESRDGCRVLIDHGKLVSTWRLDRTPPLRPAPEIGEPNNRQVPESVEIAEEADLIWRWLERSDVRLIDATGLLALPAHQVPRLRAS